MIKRVVRITQSPMNALRWVLDLECGHETWITAKRRPTRKTAQCSPCNVRPDEKEAGG